eukprot:804531-Amphidinium_carterae.1
MRGRAPITLPHPTPEKLLTVMAPHLPCLREAFELFDEDQRGKISFRNLKPEARPKAPCGQFTFGHEDVHSLEQELNCTKRNPLDPTKRNMIVVKLRSYCAEDATITILCWLYCFSPVRLLGKSPGCDSFLLHLAQRIARDLGEKLTDDELRGMIDEFDQ